MIICSLLAIRVLESLPMNNHLLTQPCKTIKVMQLDEIKIANEVVERFKTEGEVLIRNLKMYIAQEFPHDLPQTSENPFSFLVHYHGLPLIFCVEIIISNKRVNGRIKATKWDIVDRAERDLIEYEFDGYKKV